jgi:hypothetical protein
MHYVRIILLVEKEVRSKNVEYRMENREWGIGAGGI